MFVNTVLKTLQLKQCVKDFYNDMPVLKSSVVMIVPLMVVRITPVVKVSVCYSVEQCVYFARMSIL